MASIVKYETAAGVRWEVRYRTPNRQTTRKRGFKTKRSAEDWLHRTETQKLDGTWSAASTGRIVVADYARQYLETRQQSLSPSTLHNYRGYVDSLEHNPILRRVHVRELTTNLIERWAANLGERAKPKTVRNHFNFLHAVLQRAVRDGLIHTNPCDGAELPKSREIYVPEFLTSSEVNELERASGPYGPVIVVLTRTGLRWAEMAGLQVQDVDLERGHIHVRRQKNEVNGKLLDGLPKHGKTRRVPIVDSLRPVLEAAIADKPDDALVFTTGRGAVLRNSNARRGWFNAAAKAIGKPRLRPHDLRHSFASLAVQAGVNPKALQAVMGHATIKITLDRYAHLYPSDFDIFAAQFDVQFR